MLLDFTLRWLLFLYLARSTKSQESTGSLCSQLYRLSMSQACFRDGGTLQASSIQARVGKSGPRGLRGPPGRDAEINYGRIEELISQKCDGLEALKERVARLEKLQSWHKASDGRYFQLFKELVNYTTAAAICQSHDSILASAGVRNPNTRGELLNIVRSGGGDTWIGLNDKVLEGRFVWEDGAVASPGNVDWNRLEPSDSRGREDCAHYWKAADFRMNDAPCELPMYFICEKSM